MKAKFLLITCISVLHFYVFPQDRNEKISDSVDVLIQLSDQQNLNSNFQDALEYATLAVEHAHTSNDVLVKGRATICLANAYQMVDDHINAKKYFMEVLESGKELDNYFLKAASLNGLGNVYSQDLSTADVATEYYEEAIAYATEAKKDEHIFIGYMNISSMYLDFKESDKALPFLHKAETQLSHLKNQSPIYFAMLNLNFGSYYYNTENYSEALNYVNKAQKIGEENELYLDLIDIYDLKAKIHQSEGDYDAALEDLRKRQEYKDLNYSADKAERIEEIQAKFKLSQYENEIKVTRARNRNIIMTSVGILLLITTLFVLYFLRKKRLDNHKLINTNSTLQSAKEEADRVNKSKSDLLINISHELRTPVYGILGITSMLMEEAQDSDYQKELLGALKFSGEKLRGLVNNILRHEEIHTRTIFINKTPTNLHQLVIDSVSPFMAKARKNQNGLKLNISPDISKVYDIDSDKITEVLVNLISNANKFTNQGSVELEVKLKEKHNTKDTIAFSIKDTGVGMNKEQLDTIFESFKQAEINTVYGAGLGLSIAKHLIETMGGEIDVKSELNEGSEFTFTIDLDISEPETEEELTTYTKKNLNILVVEDNKINQLVTRKLLSKIGYECVITENGLEAVEACKENEFDLVLMDINMPVMNGLDATVAIKSFKPQLLIIALTALEISEIKFDCDKAGLDDVINKPINEEQLDVVINKNLARFLQV